MAAALSSITKTIGSSLAALSHHSSSTGGGTSSSSGTSNDSNVFRASFEIFEGKGSIIRVVCSTENFDEYRTWMPFIDFGTHIDHPSMETIGDIFICIFAVLIDGTFEESNPMKAEFRAPRACHDDIVATLTKNGYHQRQVCTSQSTNAMMLMMLSSVVIEYTNHCN